MPARVETGLNIAYNTSETDEEYSFADLVEDWQNKRQPSFGTTVTEQVPHSIKMIYTRVSSHRNDLSHPPPHTHTPSRSLSLSIPPSLKPVQWSITSRMGCHNFLCPSLATSGGGKYFNAYLVVCAYDPVYYQSALFLQSTSGCGGRTGRCRLRDQQPQQCIQFRTVFSDVVLSSALCGKLVT